MQFDLTTTVAFTGHRTYRGEADATLASVVRGLYAEGFRTFLSGMAVGFDMAAAAAVVALRRECADVRFVCIVPFAGQERRFSTPDKERYCRLLAQADGVEYVRDAYHVGCYALRNDRLVDHSAVLVAWYDGSSGGTRYTVQRARRLARRVENVYQDPHPRLF